MRFLLHTALPVEAAGRAARIVGARIMGARSILTVTAGWAESAEAEVCGVDWSYTRVNRLALRSAAASRHVLKTVLELSRR